MCIGSKRTPNLMTLNDIIQINDAIVYYCYKSIKIILTTRF